MLGGHSLGGGVVTAYTTWKLRRQTGCRPAPRIGLHRRGQHRSGGIGSRCTHCADRAERPGNLPWDPFGGIPAPYAGVYSSVGATAALIAPRSPSLGQSSGLLTTFGLSPPVPVDNLAQFGYALNVGSSPPALIAAQAHLGTGITASGALRGWNGAGALTPIRRYATMISGTGVANADGSEWYFPARLTLDLARLATARPRRPSG